MKPYIFHPLRIMLTLADPFAQMAAVLHDAVEDTHLELHDLADAGYSPKLVAAIDALTHRPDESYDDYIERVAANPIGRRVKIVDLKENLANNRRSPHAPGNAERSGATRRPSPGWPTRSEPPRHHRCIPEP